MSNPEPKSADPSMAEILASIRDILNEDDDAPADEPLELTEEMLLSPVATPAPVPVDLPPVDLPPVEAPPTEASLRNALLAPATAAATAAALGELARAVAGDRAAPVMRGGSASIEDVVRDEMRPLIKAWLDQHLPGMVEQIVKSEITKLMGRDAG